MLACGTAFWTFFFTTYRLANYIGERTDLYVIFSEVFADRGYEEDGTLVNRRKEGAMITDEDEAIARVIRMVKEGVVTAVTGKDIPIQADSVCVHGDGEKALLFVEKIRKVLTENDVQILIPASLVRAMDSSITTGSDA